MPINTLQYAQIFQKELDQQIVQKATSGWMEANAGDVIYNGGSEIKIPEVSMQGLGSYDRDTGHPHGSVTFGYRTYKMTQDRARKFSLDENDVDETNFGTAAATVMSEFQRTKVVPEIDAYRYSKLANVAGITDATVMTASNVLNKLYEQLYAVADKGADLENLVISISYKIFALLNTNDKISRHIGVADFKRGDVMLKFKSLDGAILIPVASNRMKTAFDFYDGRAEGQEDGGFAPKSGAVDINWIITPKNAPIAVSKTDRIKIFAPDVNQRADAYDLHYHKYHELFVPNQRRAAIAVSTSAEFTQVNDEIQPATSEGSGT